MPVLIVEGAFSVLALAQAGYVAVATLGAQLSDDQAELLVSLQRPLVLLYDGDAAGQAGMRAAAGKLITKAFVRVVKLDEEEQPDTLNAEQLRSYLSFVPLKGSVP